MNTYFVTFGNKYDNYNKHPQGGHKDGWVEIKASNMEMARTIVINFMGTAWAFLYDVDTFRPSFYPRGCLYCIYESGSK